MINANSKKGFISIEAILSMTIVLMIFLIIIGFFVSVIPRISLQSEVHALTQKAKLQGGLTDATSEAIHSDVENFKDALVAKGYNRDTIEVHAFTKPSGLGAMGVTPLDAEGSNYIKRDSDELMYIVVNVPDKSFINAPLQFFGIRRETPTISFVETVMSERW